MKPAAEKHLKKRSKEAATILESAESLIASATEADNTVLLCERKYLFRFSK
jgi:hypothetical protein